jgi:hypothetical protein
LHNPQRFEFVGQSEVEELLENVRDRRVVSGDLIEIFLIQPDQFRRLQSLY